MSYFKCFEFVFGLPWNGVADNWGVQYGGMFYPGMPRQQMHHPMEALVIVSDLYNYVTELGLNA